MNFPRGITMSALVAGFKRLPAMTFAAFLSAAPLFSQSNPVTLENAFAGSPASEWDISGYGDETIQGFATPFSINTGGTVNFKIDVPAGV